jgi:hypothetical protein
MAIGGNQYYAPIFGAVDALVKQNQDQRAYKRRMDEVENQREYAAKTYREKLIGNLIFGEYGMPNQTPESLTNTRQQAMDYIQSPDRTSDFYNNFRRAEENQEPVIEKQRFRPSPFVNKYFENVFDPEQLYDQDVIWPYEEEATRRKNDWLDHIKQPGSGGGSGEKDKWKNDPIVIGLRDAMGTTLKFHNKGQNKDVTNLEMDDKGRVKAFSTDTKSVGENTRDVAKHYNKLKAVLDKYMRGETLTEAEKQLAHNPQAYVPLDAKGVQLQNEILETLKKFNIQQDSLESALEGSN